MKYIPLNSEKYPNLCAIVDDDDFDKVKLHSWGVQCCRAKLTELFYAITRASKKRILLHVLVLGKKENMETDHINKNTLDNRKSNLRFVSHSQSMMNRRKINKATSSKYKGVYFDKQCWIAQIKKEKKRYTIGRFDNQFDAAIAYDKAAVEYHGEFASINFPAGI